MPASAVRSYSVMWDVRRGDAYLKQRQHIFLEAASRKSSALSPNRRLPTYSELKPTDRDIRRYWQKEAILSLLGLIYGSITHGEVIGLSKRGTFPFIWNTSVITTPETLYRPKAPYIFAVR